jgi:hypothetical protein
MKDGSKRIRCGGTEWALERLDAGLNCTIRQHLLVFDKHRACLEQHATDKYDANELETDGRVLVKAADI